MEWGDVFVKNKGFNHVALDHVMGLELFQQKYILCQSHYVHD